MTTKNLGLVICFLVLTFFSVSKTKGDLVFNDGQVHNIETYIGQEFIDGENIVVQDAPNTGMPTILKILPGGIIEAFLFVENNSQIQVSGGEILGDLYAYENSQIAISNGGISGNLWGYDNSRTIFSGGEIKGISFFDRSRAMVSGGTMNSLTAEGNSQITIFNAEIKDSLIASDNSEIIISGGKIKIGAEIYAGWPETIPSEPEDNSTITLLGTNFAINGMPVDYGQIDAIEYPTGFLSGTLANGDLVGNQFQIYGSSKIILAVPEPRSIILLLIIGIFAPIFVLLEKNKVKEMTSPSN